MRALLYEASTRIYAIHPSGLPLACSRRDGSAALGLPSKLHTPPTRSRRVTPRRGQVIEHEPGTTRSTHIGLILQSVVHSLRATSRRTVRSRTDSRGGQRSCSSCVSATRAAGFLTAGVVTSSQAKAPRCGARSGAAPRARSTARAFPSPAGRCAPSVSHFCWRIARRRDPRDVSCIRARACKRVGCDPATRFSDAGRRWPSSRGRARDPSSRGQHRRHRSGAAAPVLAAGADPV